MQVKVKVVNGASRDEVVGQLGDALKECSISLPCSLIALAAKARAA